MRARILIMLKPSILDPQGQAIGHALGALGFDGIDSVRQGKVIDLDLSDTNADAAEARIKAMCTTLLANAVIEDFSIEILD